jgi:hypothetical protein
VAWVLMPEVTAVARPVERLATAVWRLAGVMPPTAETGGAAERTEDGKGVGEMRSQLR